MPITYRIDSQLGVVFTTANGILTADELFMHKQSLCDDPDFVPGMAELSDVRKITRLEVTAEAVRGFAYHDAADAGKLGHGYKLAIVTAEDLVFGMARMYEMLTEKNLSGIQIFRDMNLARKWLSLPPQIQ